MLLLKPRKKTSELRILEYLHTRINLQPKDKHYYISLKKGYEGEKNFDLWTAKLQRDCIILNDLLLKINNTTFQIDSLIITTDQAYLYEVKNFEGDYIYDEQRDKFFTLSKQEIINPLHQMERCTSLLRKLLYKHGLNIPIEGNVVFINEAFTLYQAPTDKPIIYRSQLNKYFNQLDTISTPLSKNRFSLADKLKSLHFVDPQYNHIPPYHYEQLHKGIVCPKCNSLSMNIGRLKAICGKCGYEESIAEAVIRSTREFRLLFPEEKITSNIIQDWCRDIKSKKTISNILGQHFRTAGKNRWIYYE